MKPSSGCLGAWAAWLFGIVPFAFAAVGASDSGGAHIVTLRAGVDPEKVCHVSKVKAGRTFRHACLGPDSQPLA